MRGKIYLNIAVIGATLLFLALWQPAAAGPPEEPGNPGLPGCLAKVSELEARIVELEDMLQNFAPVAKTGQTVCYDTNGNIIQCAGTGQDGEYQYGTPWPEPRFTDNLDGTVTDNLTQLLWLKNANCYSGEISWQEALDTSNNLADGLCGLSDGSVPGDWRLPNLKELQSLIDYGNSYPPLPSGHPFTFAQFLYCWSSTTDPYDSDRAWSVAMSNANLNNFKKDYTSNVWPVRGGN